VSELDAMDAPAGTEGVALEIKANSTSGDVRVTRATERSTA
jgi:hypothetical protein